MKINGSSDKANALADTLADILARHPLRALNKSESNKRESNERESNERESNRKINRELKRQHERLVNFLTRPSEPPSSANLLLSWLVPLDRSEEVLGDFVERYKRKFRNPLTNHETFLAKLDYWWDVLRSAPGFLQLRINSISLTAKAKR